MEKIILKIKAKDLKAKMGLKDGRDGKDGISIKGDKGDQGKEGKTPDISEIVKRTTDILTPLIPKPIEIIKQIPTTSGYGGLNVYAGGVKKGSMRTLDFIGLTYSKVNGRDTLTVNETDPLSLHLDQTTSQTILNGQPIWNTLTASELVATDASKKLQSLAVATYPSLTELSYVKGLSSAVQTQLNSKNPGGSDTQVQFNDGGAFGGDAGLTYNKTNNTLTLLGADAVRLILKANASQTANLQNWANSSGTALGYVDYRGGMNVRSLNMGSAGAPPTTAGNMTLYGAEPQIFLYNISLSNHAFRFGNANDYFSLYGKDNVRHWKISYADGLMGIGINPTARVHIKEGTATVGTAPLKFTSGTNLTTAEAGTMEYDGTNLSFTPTGTLRKNIHTGGRGSVTLTAGTTSTVTDVTAKTTSTIILSPTSLAVIALTPYVSTKSNGSFVITTLTAAGTETLDYLIIN